MTPLAWPSVYAVSDRRRLAPDARTAAEAVRALEAWADALIAATVDIIQIRERDLPGGVLRRLAGDLTRRTAGTGTRVVVSDRADVVMAADAAGVHLPSNGLLPPAVRSLMPDRIIGRSVHGADPAIAASACDYVMYGTVFPSRSKAGGAATSGVGGLQAAVERFPCPVVAIGGITATRLEEVVATGARGIAAIGAFLPEGREPGALGPWRAVETFRQALRRGMLQ